MDNLRIFESPEFGQVRTKLYENGMSWFVGIDVANALGYVKPRNAIAMHVDEEGKTTALIQGAGSSYISQAVL